MKSVIHSHREQLEERDIRMMEQQGQLDVLVARTAAMTDRKNQAGRLIHTLTHQIQETEAAYHKEKLRVRKWIQAAATGENLGRFETRNGRIYEDARIVRISEAGMKIRHKSGSAFIRANELPANLRERLLISESPHQPDEKPSATSAGRL